MTGFAQVVARWGAGGCKMQIPYGNDKQRGNGKSNGKGQYGDSGCARMTAFYGERGSVVMMVLW